VESYKQALGGLNPQQRAAVEQIDGPLLVIAGPGTGKTQLISTRVGYILDNTDTPADAILLLTFTEAGAQAMRDRLARLIGKPAYDVQINTYHAFGGEIFRQYPDFFEAAELTLLEELGKDTLLRGIIAKLPYSNPLKFADVFLNDIKGFISDSKRALLSPDDIRKIAASNLRTITYLNRTARPQLDRLEKISKASQPVFEELVGIISAYPAGQMPDDVLPLAGYAQGELQSALEHLAETSKTTLLTEWKRQWLAKDEDGQFIFDGQRQNLRLEAAAGIYKRYQQALQDEHLYDYDDMILRAINALQNNQELKYSLAERYSYIMLDEFQDTNPAQFKLVQLLNDHPVNEGRPNVMAVGDDDQAIYAFQGAEHANMAVFARHYRDVRLITLKQNYRSQQAVIDTGRNIARQIQSGLQHEFPDIDKNLKAANNELPEPPHIEARQFISDAAQYEWVAEEIKRLIKSGIKPGEIAVLAPKHRYLTPLLPYLVQAEIPIHYERRENILDEPLVHQLERMSQLALAIADGDETSASSIWPEVISYEYWQVPTEKIWRINWQVRESHEPWTAQLLNDEVHSYIAEFFIKLAAQLPVTSLEQQLDVLIGLPATSQRLGFSRPSPLYGFYFTDDARQHSPAEFTKLISDLNVLRSRLEDWRRSRAEPASLRSFVEFAEGHRAAGINILNTSPYHEAESSVSLLTAYGSKGREFQAVFIVAALDEVWGSASRNQGYRLSLPANLSYIRYQGASEDERLRLLYVAATRAKTRLYFTSYSKDLAGKGYTPLKYLEVNETEQGLEAETLPPEFKKIKLDEKDALSVTTAINYWEERHLPPLGANLKEALAPRLQTYKLNQTDLTKFIDIINQGPERFFMECFLRFPSAPSFTKAYGTAIHNMLRFIGRIFIEEGVLPSEARVMDIFAAQMRRIDLPPDELENLEERGRLALRQWLKQQGASLKTSDRFEYNFRSEGSSSGDARLGGIVDRLIIDERSRKITVLDYKVGRPYATWQKSVVKLHNFRRQLLFYKLLVESSARFKNYQVTKGIIEFVEPDEHGRIQRLELDYDEPELQQMRQLIGSVWRRIQNLELPDTSQYPKTVGGILQFEAELRANQKPAE
jgi:DNA helicase-2/ATP-dependent DNA helicase PcrA